jgi:uncharacterized phage protein gp47/JayE
MSLVFNDCVLEEDQRKVCAEYELTMDEDLHEKFKEWKERDEEIESIRNSQITNDIDSANGVACVDGTFNEV